MQREGGNGVGTTCPYATHVCARSAVVSDRMSVRAAVLRLHLEKFFMYSLATWRLRLPPGRPGARRYVSGRRVFFMRKDSERRCGLGSYSHGSSGTPSPPPETLDFNTGFAHFFARLEQLEFTRAGQAALRLPCARRLAAALRDLCTCESLYFSLAHLNHHTLEKRLDSTARELEACLSMPAPLGLQTSWAMFVASPPPRRASIALADADPRDTSERREPTRSRMVVVAEGPSHSAEPTALAAEGGGPVPCLLMAGHVLHAALVATLECRPPNEWQAALKAAAQQSASLEQMSPQFPRRPTPPGTPDLSEASLPLTFTAAQRGALSDTVELLRLRRAMLPIYSELLNAQRLRDTNTKAVLSLQQLADRVKALRLSRAAAIGAPLLAGMRELTLVEMGTLEPLLRAHALLPELMLRDTLLHLAVARQQLSTLKVRWAAVDAASRQVAPPSPFNFALSGLGSSLAAAHGVGRTPLESEPHLHFFLRSFAARLTDKANFYLRNALSAHRMPPAPAGASHHPDGASAAECGLGTPIPGVVASSGSNANMGAASTPLSAAPPKAAAESSLDFAAMIDSFVAKQSPLLAAVLAKPTGLHLVSDAVRGTYSRRPEEAPVGDTPRHASGSASGVPQPWPTLFVAPRNANADTMLRALWPTVAALLEKHAKTLRSPGMPVHSVVSVDELNGAEHSFWLQHTDERVVVLLAFAGKKRTDDAGASTLLQTLDQGLRHDKLIEGSLREEQQPGSTAWWRLLLGGRRA